jgi:hypothetical protein
MDGALSQLQRGKSHEHYDSGGTFGKFDKKPSGDCLGRSGVFRRDRRPGVQTNLSVLATDDSAPGLCLRNGNRIPLSWGQGHVKFGGTALVRP